jgi:hypothetical protein
MPETAVVVAMAINSLDNFNCLTSVFIIVEVARTRCRATPECKAHLIEGNTNPDLHK